MESPFVGIGKLFVDVDAFDCDLRIQLDQTFHVRSNGNSGQTRLRFGTPEARVYREVGGPLHFFFFFFAPQHTLHHRPPQQRKCVPIRFVCPQEFLHGRCHNTSYGAGEEKTHTKGPRLLLDCATCGSHFALALARRDKKILVSSDLPPTSTTSTTSASSSPQ